MKDIDIDEHISMMKEMKQWIDDHINSDDSDERERAERYQRARLCWYHEGIEVLKKHKVSREKLRSIFLDLWGVAAVTSEYDKKIWTSFQVQLRDIGVNI